MRLDLILIVILVCLVTESTAVCSKITISDTYWQILREGTYVLDPDLTCNGRPVYSQQSAPGGNYLYYLQGELGWSGWIVGPEECVNSGGVAVESEADTPDTVDAPWEEVYEEEWHYNPGLKVTCANGLSGGAIAGIVVGCVVVIVVIIVIIVCCCCGKETHGESGGHRTEPMGHRSSRVATVMHPTTSAASYHGYPANHPGAINPQGGLGQWGGNSYPGPPPTSNKQGPPPQYTSPPHYTLYGTGQAGPAPHPVSANHDSFPVPPANHGSNPLPPITHIPYPPTNSGPAYPPTVE